MSLAKQQKKFCRACLKEIRNGVASTDILEPPAPVVQLRDGVKASSYLQCYYHCLRFNSSNFNAESLSDYSFLCPRCKGLLMKAVDFIVRSQRNEDFLTSMYGKSTHDTTAIGLSDDLFGSDENELNDDEASSHSKEDNSKTDIGEECLDIIDDSTCEADTLHDLQDTDSEWEISEVEALSDLRTIEVDNSDDVIQKDEDIEKVNLEQKDDLEKGDEVMEGFEQVIIDTRKDVCETEKTDVQKMRAENAALNRTTKVRKRSKKKPAKGKYLCFKCELCRKVFKLERHLYEHYDNEHDQRSLSFPCDICKNRHISDKAMMFHKRRIHKNIDYDDCAVCGKLILSAFFKAHKERHSRDVKYECQTCNRTFAAESALNKHYKAVHGNSKVQRYECPDCDRYFFAPENLKLHALVHEENNPQNVASTFLCDICSKTFGSKYNLKLHLQIHRGETMKCPHCEKEFITLKDMQIHIRFHTKDFPFKCDICPRRFAIKTHVDHHRKQHEGVRYKCQICDKEFGHTFSLTQHSYQHRGYPLSCKLCSKGYPSLFKIRLHLKNAHSSLFDGEYSDSVAAEYYKRNVIDKMYPRVEFLGST